MNLKEINNILLLQPKTLFVFIMIGVLYFIFPTHNSTLDAYNYAASVKYSENLFSPHHLLYNAFIYSILHPLLWVFPNMDALSFSKVINTFFVIGILIILFKLLTQLKFQKNEALLWITGIAFSYNFLRYGTENETYIIPVFFSVWGSYYFLKYVQNPRYFYIFLSGLLASIACLFHQIHFFWWLGLLLGVIFYIYNIKTIFYYSISAIIVPVVYLLVLSLDKGESITYTHITRFIFHDFYSGSARSEIGVMNFLFIGISVIRSFFQVHPNISLLIKKNTIFILPVLVFLVWGFYSTLCILKKKILRKRNETNIIFYKTSLIILVLHVLFAFYAVGNVEFLVMLPVLLVFTIGYYFKFFNKFLLNLIVILFIWNFMYGLFPNNAFNYYNDKELINFIFHHPNSIFIVENSSIINQYYYQTGIDNYEKILLKEKGFNQEKIDSLLQIYPSVYTDIIDKPSIFNRAYLLSDQNGKTLDISQYKIEKVFEYQSFYGTTYINKISKEKSL